MKIQIINSAGTFTIDGGDLNQEGLERFVEVLSEAKYITINDLELGAVTLRKEFLVNSA